MDSDNPMQRTRTVSPLSCAELKTFLVIEACGDALSRTDESASPATRSHAPMRLRCPRLPHPTPYSLLHPPSTLYPPLSTLRPPPHTLHPTHHTVHPTPYTPHFSPFTPHPPPSTCESRQPILRTRNLALSQSILVRPGSSPPQS